MLEFSELSIGGWKPLHIRIQSKQTETPRDANMVEDGAYHNILLGNSDSSERLS